jgi:cell division septation protein DedD
VVSTIEQAPGLLDNRGSLNQTPLLTLLQSKQAQRATGTLQVRNGGEAYSLFFLFGHLFHAYGNGSQGEDAVFTPLSWRQGDYSFDPKSKLPTEETITAPTADILAEAKRRGVPGADNGPAPTREAAQAAAPTPAAPQPQVSERPVVSQPPGAAQPQAAAPEEGPPPTELYPLPVGKLVYESLKTAFVDFPKLLRSLSSDRLTGYLRLTGLASRGMILFYQGSLIESFYDGGAVVSTGRTAFSLFKNDVDRGEGSMDVIELSPEVVTAIYQLLTAPTILQGLLARFVDIRALLQYLQEEKIHGSLLVRAPEEMGIILLRDGQLLGAFTRGQPQLMQDPEAVTRLCADSKTRIEVKAVADLEEPASVSLEEMLAMTPSVPSTVYRPAPAAAPSGPAAQAAAPQRAPSHQPAPQPPQAPAAAEPDIDWTSLMSQLNQMADNALQNRSKKVKEMLASTEHNVDGLDRTIDRISQTSIMFVDPARLTNLANEMRQLLEEQR